MASDSTRIDVAVIMASVDVSNLPMPLRLNTRFKDGR